MAIRSKILKTIRDDMIIRCGFLIDDRRSEAEHVIGNNVKILNHLSEAISLAEDSTKILDKAFGPSASGQGGPPRIGSG